MARVRVYLLTYRRSQLLPRALRSLLAQSFTDWVCELHNDAPDDAFPGELAIQTGDPRIVLHQHPYNLGATRTFNLVFAPVAEEFVCLLEDDNWWEPGFLSSLLAVADAHQEAAFVWCNMRIWQEEPDGQWTDTGKHTAGLMWPDHLPTTPTWFHWPQPQQRFDTLHYNGSTLFRTAALGPLQIDPSVPQLAMETFRDRALRWPGLFISEQLVNFAWTLATWREPQTDIWLVCRALLDASFLRCCPRDHPSASALWESAAESKPSQTGDLLLHAWLAGRLDEFSACARPRDWLRVAAHAAKHPRRFWQVLRARAQHPQLWQFLLTQTAQRFRESAPGDAAGWGHRPPARPIPPS